MNISENIFEDSLLGKSDSKSEINAEKCTLDTTNIITEKEKIKDPYEFEESDSEIDNKTQPMSINELLIKYDVVSGSCILDITAGREVEDSYETEVQLTSLDNIDNFVNDQNMNVEENSCSSSKSVSHFISKGSSINHVVIFLPYFDP